MARKLRPDEVRVFEQNSEVPGSLSDLQALLRDAADAQNGGFDFTAIDPVWIKGSMPDQSGS